MNLASWIILAVVVTVVALAVKATFFKKKRTGGCCDVGDADKGVSTIESAEKCSLADAGPAAFPSSYAYGEGLACGGGPTCASCPLRPDSVTARNMQQPTYRPLP